MVWWQAARFCVVGLCLCVTAASGLCEDWPRWGRDQTGNMVSPAKGIPASFDPGRGKGGGFETDMSTTKTVRWVARLGSLTYGNPVVAGGKVVVGTNDASLRDSRIRRTKGGMFYCFDEKTGKTLWQLPVPRFRTKDRKFNYDDMNLGVCASVTIEGDRAYALTNRGEALCLDMNGLANGNDGPFTDEGQFMAGIGNKPVVLKKDIDGDIIWAFDMVHDLPVWPQDASSGVPLVHGDFVYVPTSNGVDRSHTKVPYPDAPSLIVLDKKTGRLVGGDDEKIGRRLFHGQWSTPTLGVVSGKPQIYYGAGDGFVYAFEPLTKHPPQGQLAKLKMIWKCDANPHDYKFHSGKRVPYQKKHYPFNHKPLGTGPSEITGTPVFYKNRIYVAVGQDPRHGRGLGALTCMDATGTGDVTKTKIVWQSTEPNRSLATPSIAGGLLFLGDYSGRVMCFDADTGKLYWRHETGQPMWSSTLAVDGKVFIGTEGKDLWVFAAAKEEKLLGKIRLREKMSNTPIVANGVLYVASNRFLTAVAETAKGK